MLVLGLATEGEIRKQLSASSRTNIWELLCHPVKMNSSQTLLLTDEFGRPAEAGGERLAASARVGFTSYNCDGSNAETHNRSSVWCRLPSPSLLTEMTEGLGVRRQGQTFVEVLSVLMASEVLLLLSGFFLCCVEWDDGAAISSKKHVLPVSAQVLSPRSSHSTDVRV